MGSGSGVVLGAGLLLSPVSLSGVDFPVDGSNVTVIRTGGGVSCGTGVADGSADRLTCGAGDVTGAGASDSGLAVGSSLAVPSSTDNSSPPEKRSILFSTGAVGSAGISAVACGRSSV